MWRWISRSTVWRYVTARWAGSHPCKSVAGDRPEAREFDGLLDASIRRALQDSLGRRQPSAMVWQRIEAELRAPSREPRPLPPAGRSRLRWVMRLDSAVALRGAAVVALVVFLLLTTLDDVPDWWHIPGARVTPTMIPGRAPGDLHAPEALSSLYWPHHQQNRVAWGSYRSSRDGRAVAMARIADADVVPALESAENRSELSAASLLTPALRLALASQPEDIPPRISLLLVSQPVVLSDPQGTGLIQ